MIPTPRPNPRIPTFQVSPRVSPQCGSESATFPGDASESSSQNIEGPSRYFRALRAFQPSPERRSPRLDPDIVAPDPGQNVVDPQPPFRVFPPRRIFQPSPPRRSPSPDAGLPRNYMPGRAFQPSPPPRGMRRPDPDTMNPGSIQDIKGGYVVLFCGLEIEESDVSSAFKAPLPQILPSPPSPTPEPPHKRQKRSTGCGARVHTSARVARHWRGSGSGAGLDVIPLERTYFPPEAIKHLNLHEENCGCAIRGVGCRVCGNPLGALETRCELHRGGDPDRAYAFLPCAVSPPLQPFQRPSPPPPPAQHIRPPRRTARMSTGGRPPRMPLRPVPAAANDDDLSESSDEDSPPPPREATRVDALPQ
ncbi:hypothetical protein C8J57DRAFT_1479187 [Mycena rebaudengoi]|nr:hypothetical protein C8J57DRAFT_1479187 [Mycena rebaudengoi]